MHLDLVEVVLQIRHLLLYLFAVQGQHVEKLLQLGPGVAGAIVHIDDVFGFRQAQSEALGPQGKLEAGPVASAVDSAASTGSAALGLLRQQRDRDALRAALADGTIDALVSDHTPVDEDAKALPFAESEPGATGLELLLSLTLKWATESGTPLVQALATVSSRPAAVIGNALGALQDGVGQIRIDGPADLCVFDPTERWVVTPDALWSQGKNTPFGSYELPGKVRTTLVAGQIAFSANAT